MWRTWIRGRERWGWVRGRRSEGYDARRGGGYLDVRIRGYDAHRSGVTGVEAASTGVGAGTEGEVGVEAGEVAGIVGIRCGGKRSGREPCFQSFIIRSLPSLPRHVATASLPQRSTAASVPRRPASSVLASVDVPPFLFLPRCSAPASESLSTNAFWFILAHFLMLCSLLTWYVPRSSLSISLFLYLTANCLYHCMLRYSAPYLATAFHVPINC